MHWLRFAVLLLVSTLLQKDLLNAIDVAGIKPDLLLILLAFFAIFREPREAIIASFSIGLAADLIGPSMGPGWTFGFRLMLSEQVHLSQVDAFSCRGDICTRFCNSPDRVSVKHAPDSACVSSYIRRFVRNAPVLGDSRAVFVLAHSILDAYKNTTPTATIELLMKRNHERTPL